MKLDILFYVLRGMNPVKIYSLTIDRHPVMFHHSFVGYLHGFR